MHDQAISVVHCSMWQTQQANKEARKESQCIEPLNRGHFGSKAFVLYSEAVLLWEVRITCASTIVISIGAAASVGNILIEVVLWWEGVHYRINTERSM